MKRHALLVPDMPAREALAPYLARIDEARWYSNFGPLVRELEARLAGLLPAPAGPARVATVANATLGLELALAALGLPPGARVLVPALTFVASASAIVRAGLAPVVCDVDPARWQLTPEIARRLAPAHGIAAVMPVATYGCPQDPAAWDRFSADTGVPAVIDAAGAYGNQAVAARALTVFSMHATKTFAAGEGGFVASGDAERVAQVRTLTNFGIQVPGGLVRVPGTNAKLSEYHAAAALAALDGWEARRRRRVEVHRRYLERLARDCPGVALQARAPDGVYAILPALLPEGRDAAAVMDALAARGVETRRWYCPTLERHPAFAGCAVAGELRVAAALNARLLALPFHAFLGEADIAEVCGALAAALA